MDTTPKLLQGVFFFKGAGLEKPVPLDAALNYKVPADKSAQLIYFRAGNSCPELIYLSLMRDGALMRHFPVGAKADSHVSLAVVEDIPPDTKLEVLIAAPMGAAGAVVVDIGLIEI
ncbi:MAG: molybdopterin oxidoreductase [Beijerinckiaceae bacterium]|nr:molybdopterin oxidoreductase [Beijerinckiaceae bacterium]